MHDVVAIAIRTLAFQVLDHIICMSVDAYEMPFTRKRFTDVFVQYDIRAALHPYT